MRNLKILEFLWHCQQILLDSWLNPGAYPRSGGLNHELFWISFQILTIIFGFSKKIGKETLTSANSPQFLRLNKFKVFKKLNFFKIKIKN